MSQEADRPSPLIPNDVDEAIARINASFYRQRPHAYLSARMQALLVMCGRPDVISEVLVEGVSVAGIRTSQSSWSPDPEDHVDFLTLESEVLLFQTAEVLLRLVLAHAPTDSSSPALNMAALKSHRDFYRRVERHIRDADDEDLDDIVATTVHGTDSLDRLQLVAVKGDDSGYEPTQAGLDEGRANIRGLLRFLADYVLSDNCRDLYNSAKHGLAARTGHMGFRIGGSEDRPPIIDQSGQALTCITVGRRNEHGEQPVDDVFVWSNPAQAMGLVYTSLMVMDAVWQLGRLRHTGEEPDEGFVFRTFEGNSVTAILRAAYDLGPSRGEGSAFVTNPHFRLPTGIVL